MRRKQVLQSIVVLSGFSLAGCGETYRERTYYPPPRERVVYRDRYDEPAPPPPEPYSADPYARDSSPAEPYSQRSEPVYDDPAPAPEVVSTTFYEDLSP